jgi:hypothetical protein
VLAARGEIDYPIFLFANTGNDSEHPDALAYVREIAMPFADRSGIEFHEVQKRWRGKGALQTLRGEIYRRERSVPIPARMSNGAPGNRTCTIDFKIKVVDKWIAENGGRTAELVTVGLGISTDEIHRAKVRPIQTVRRFQKAISYPLIVLGLNRSQCQSIIAAAGLPMAPRSSCYFCPFHSRDAWIRLRQQSPDLFEQAASVEDHINMKRSAVLGKDFVFLHYALRPLRDAVGEQFMLPDFGDDTCEDGYCLT